MSDLAVSLIGILFITYCVKNNNFTYFKNKYFFIYFLKKKILILIINSLINNFNLGSLKIFLFFTLDMEFCIAIAAFLDFDESFIKYFFYCIFFCFSALIIDGFYEYFVGHNILGWKNYESSRISSFFGEEKILGSYLSRLWPIFFAISIFILKQRNILFFYFY